MAKRTKNTSVGAKRGYRVFVSHATADKWIATTFCEKIDSLGAKSFRDDRDIDGGDDIPDAIHREILVCDEFLVLLTPESANRPWVLFEAGAAWGRMESLTIVTILCHTSADTIPGILKSKKAYSINQFDEYLRVLRQRIERQRP